MSHNAGLALCVVVLAALCIHSVSTPLRFQRQQTQREKAVKRRLMAIRTAEERYRQRHDAYTADWGALVGEGLLADSLQYIPYGEGRRFELTANMQLSKSGRQLPLMECGARYAAYLSGLDERGIARLTEEATAAGRYPGLKIGDLETPNNNAGNWE